MLKIPCMMFRGGTSKGPFFLKTDLPSDANLRDQLLLSLMGSPHDRQIDGIGGGDSLSSKVAIVGSSEREDADIDYLFCQVHINEPIVETTLNCGNMLSAVAPFAIAKGLVKTTDPETVVRIYNENTGVVMIATVQTPKGDITYEGNIAIDGVPGTAAPIKLSFINSVGAKTGKLLPTGNIVDIIDGVSVSCVDVAVPMVITYAEAMGKTGYESKVELDSDKIFMEKLEELRRAAALKMGLGDVSRSVSPKICMISKARNGGSITSRYFTPFDCHDAHAVSGGLCLAAACFIEGSVAYNVAKSVIPKQNKFEQEVIIEHPSGKIRTSVNIDKTSGNLNFPLASFTRTARPLFEGSVIIASPVKTQCEH
ncbi:MAG: 4-oxalomesaconate tautomerase [Gammaproteobacteria bacterium RIFCSPHIGHO2_12_FULL_38_11]|nr:MAG: 4-oxalomesaconate tautomerase [Gammaproteobacteria bacterium RIFCSPHIGHO2_12_FULL_38_11]